MKLVENLRLTQQYNSEPVSIVLYCGTRPLCLVDFLIMCLI